MIVAQAAIGVRLADHRTAPVVIEHCVESRWHSVYSCKLPVVDEHEDLESLAFTISCDDVWALSHDRQIRPVRGEYQPPFPAGKFVAIRRGDELFRIEIPWASRFVVQRSPEGARLKAWMWDRGSCGLAMWRTLAGAPTHARTLPVLLDQLERVEDCPWIEPYPGRVRAVVCLTDHPDFDTAAKLEQLTELFVKAGITFTKGVFPKSQPSGHKNEPGLDHADYLTSIKVLHEHGSEIAFHGFGPRVDAPPLDECKRRCEAMAPFSPQTWIDHGTGRYLFTRENAHDGVPLRELIRPLGVRNYWSYVDIWDNPISDLSCWDGRITRSVPAEIARTMARLARQPHARQRVKAQLYPAMHGLNNILGVHATNLLRTQRWTRSTPSMLRHLRRELLALQGSPFVIYGEDGGGYALGQPDDWIFDTILLNHPAVQLNETSIERLVARSGLLLAHVYLCAEHSYLRGGCFAPSDRPKLNPSFVRTIRSLSSAQRDGLVSTMSFSSLRETLEAHRRTSLERIDDGWMVRRPRSLPTLRVAGTTRVIEEPAVSVQ